MFTLQTTQNNRVASPNSFAFDKTPARSFRDKKGPNVKPWGNHALMSANEEASSLSTTFCFLFIKKLHIRFKILSDMSFYFSLRSCHHATLYHLL